MTLTIADVALNSRFFLGSAGYPSPEVLRQSIVASGAQVVTLGLRRQLGVDQGAQSDNGFVDVVRSTGVHLLPNTAGCRSAREAVTLAMMSRELLGQAGSRGRRTNFATRPF